MHLAILLIIVIAAIACSCVLNAWVTARHENAWFALPIYLVTAPGCFVALLVPAVLSIPYFWLYPERHAHIIDFRGSAEQKDALCEYRRACNERGLVRRFLESVKLVPDGRPEWPDILSDEPWEDSEDDKLV